MASVQVVLSRLQWREMIKAGSLTKSLANKLKMGKRLDTLVMLSWMEMGLSSLSLLSTKEEMFILSLRHLGGTLTSK